MRRGRREATVQTTERDTETKMIRFRGPSSELGLHGAQNKTQDSSCHS